ncbi:zinc finger, CCHC-type containing protein [Tanacetum coccineum]|uniref:Zinc finger, CCHC-type containing protein n=1 Tax=Tanacetum coccineum TaxID=301880 RepID=A0ABQ5ANM7_9ASTR
MIYVPCTLLIDSRDADFGKRIAMASRDAGFWKEAIQDEMDSIMHNNTWKLADLPPGCKPLGSKWIFKRKIRFVMPGNDNKVCNLVKSLYGLKQAPKQWHQKFDDVVLSNGFALNQADKYVYSKFDASGKGVIICLYVDDMLIFGTNQDQVDITKEFLSSKFDMKDMGEADVILGVKIIRGEHGITISQSHYIEKMLDKFNLKDFSPIGTPMDPTTKLVPNKGVAVNQLEYSKAIGSLMYAMISTRPDIAFAVGKLSRYTHNPSLIHWKAINRVFQYLKGTMDYGLTYTRFLLYLEVVCHMLEHAREENLSINTDSTIESEFLSLAASWGEAPKGRGSGAAPWEQGRRGDSPWQDFRRWQKKMHFYLTNLKVVYVLSTPCPMAVENETLEQTQSAKELWDSLESKYMAEDASSKKFLVGNFINYKMVDTRPVMEQYHELQRILGQFAQYGMKMDESISVSKELNLVELGSHFQIEQSIRDMERGSVGGTKTMLGSSVNMVEEGESSKAGKGKQKFQGSNNKSSDKKPKITCWKCRKPGHFKKDCRSGKGGGKGKKRGWFKWIQGSRKDDDISWWVDSGATCHVCKNLQWFKDFKPFEDGSMLKMGNVATEPIKGLVSVNLVFTSRNSLLLNNVVYVPGIRKNLVSGIVLNNNGYKQVMESDKYILSRHGNFIGFGYLNGMFKLNLDVSFIKNSVCMASTSSSNNCGKSKLWHARLGHVHYKRLIDMSKLSLIPAFELNGEKCKTCTLTKITRQPFAKNVIRDTKLLELVHSDLCDFHSTPSLGNKKYVVTFIDDATRYCYVYLCHTKYEALDKFKIYKEEVELYHGVKIKTLRTDRGGEYYDPVYFQSTGIIHQTTAPYTPQQNGVSERKNRTLKEMVNSMLCYSGLSDGFWGEAMLTACYLLNRVPNKRNKVTPYELWHKKVPKLSYLRVWGCRAVVRLTDPKINNIGQRGIDCVFIGYPENSKCYRFYVIEPNDYVSVHSVIDSRDADFGNEDRFTSLPKPADMTASSSNFGTSDQVTDTPPEPSEARRSVRARKAKSFGDDFQLYLVEGSRNEIDFLYQYCFNIDEDPRTYSEAMASRDAGFWKEAIQDEMDSIMHNNTWKLADLPPGCKPLGSKWIFKRKMKVDGSIDKYKVRLVIQGFRQKEGIDFFDTYARVARITTIRLLLALAAIHNLVIHQMDVKTAFLKW